MPEKNQKPEKNQRNKSPDRPVEPGPCAELNTVNDELLVKVRELEEVNNDLRNLLSSTDIATLLLDEQMRIKVFTPPAATLVSLVPTDIGRPIGDLSAKVLGDDLVADASKALADLSPTEREVWTAEPGSRCYLRRIVPHRTSANRCEGVVITFVDITRRRREKMILEEEVRERTSEVRASQRRGESIIENAVDAIVAIDQKGIVDLFNPSAERMFGYAASDILGRDVKVLMPAPHFWEHDEYLENYRRTGQTNVIGIGREVEGKRKDGTTFPVDIAVSEVKEEAGVRYIATMRDLTELKRAQAELERAHALSAGIVDTTRAIILRLDREGRIMSFNRYMEELSGYRVEEVRGKDWFTTFIPPREHERIRGVFARAIGGRRTQGNINPILTKDGDEVLVEWYDDLLNLPGEPYSLIAVGMDVTARDRLEREFLQAQKMEAVGRLAGGVAHDFNNLLAGILGGLRIATQDLAADHPSRDLLTQVQEEVERGSAITRRLLDFSRVGKTSPGLMDPRETLSTGERMIRRLIGEDVEVNLDSDDSRSRIFADAGQIEQAVLNLAINARDAMPSGGKLEIRCFDADFSSAELASLGAKLEPGSYVVLSVEDTGCGMDEKTRERALEAFFTTKDPGQGTGLGLSSVATMMEHAHGHLVLESEVGVGTKVRLIFPRASAADVLKPAAPPATEEVPGGAASVAPAPEATARATESQAGETILLVEDETLVRLGVQHMLQEQGYTVLAAKDPETALELLESDGDSCDLLLTDVVLPRMGGPELAVVVREKNPGLRVLFMSAFPTEELVAQGRIPAGTFTLEKPFTDEEMVARIRGALDSAPARPPETGI